MTSEFKDREYLSGPLVGLRSFRVTPEGRLTGVVYEAELTPGVNEARCLITTGYCTHPVTRMTGVRDKSVGPAHVIAGMRCTCGFYAYFDGRNDFHSRPEYRDCTVAGIVEAGGVMTVGSRGFRASQVRLVALVVPPAPPRRPLAVEVISVLAQVGRAWVRDLLDQPEKDEPLINYPGIRFHYPNVPVYPTVTAAIEAHPLTIPEVAA